VCVIFNFRDAVPSQQYQMSAVATSNAKFQPPKPPTKAGKSSASGTGMVSSNQFGTSAVPKKGAQAGAGTTGGANKVNQIQVIYNGKIVTPQSLVPNRPSQPTAPAKVNKGTAVTSIPENESMDKQMPMKQFKKYV
jgi:hypothetical protein